MVSKKIVFLDRDGVINKKATEHNYITEVKDFIFNEGIFSICSKLSKDGFEFIVITNQRGIARGLYDEKKLNEIHQYMKDEFQKRGFNILDIFYCPHDNNSCDCRKPKDGLLKQAYKKYNISLKDSILISDTQEDIDMGNDFGIGKNILVAPDHPDDFFNKLNIKKIKIAFIKYGGLISGGSEKLLQIIAANLPKDRFEIDYFYCDPAIYIGGDTPKMETDPYRVNYMLEHKVNIKKFNVQAVDVTNPFRTWINTDFWSFFDENKYDIVQTCRAGHKEYPFIKIKNVPIIDIIALSSGSDNQYNISRVLHICNWSAQGWIKRGGDKNRIRLVSLPININSLSNDNFREELNVKNTFIYGMHQRISNDIFSEIPLLAYKEIENENTAYLLLGGGDLYKKQAMDLGIKNIYFLEATGNSEIIFKFLRTLDVYAHGRKDGEVNSQAMAEAMYFGLPIVSHVSKINNGHIECIGEAGNVVNNVEEYKKELLRLFKDKNYYIYRSTKARDIFNKNYELNGQIKRFVQIYEEVYSDPFPNKAYRILSSLHYTQNIRVILVYIYLKIRFLFNNFKKS